MAGQAAGRVVTRWTAAVLLVAGLGACGAAYDTERFWNDATFWEEGSASTAAMAALSRGDFARAESLGNDALQRNSKDPYGILALAVVYENTQRPVLARQYYQALVSMNPQATVMLGVGDAAQRRTIADIAKEHLGLLGAAGQAPAPSPMSPVRASDLGAVDDTNVITRFQTLSRLLDEGLITQDEYNQRRGANLGALLRYTAASPAVGLTRPPPPPEQVVQRLKSLAFAYEERSISAREEAAERAVILDALMPEAPQKRLDPTAPVTDQMQAAAVVGRLERLRLANVISEAEQAKEKAKVFKSVQDYNVKAEAAARAAAGLDQPNAAAPTGPGIRLSSYRSETQALAAWAGLQKKYPAELGQLRPVVTKVSLRRRGALYRLSAGTVADRKAATALCRLLHRHGQSCTATTLGE